MRPFHYLRPRNLDEALHALEKQPQARLLAGGTTLYDLMKLDVETPSHVIDINAIPELHELDTQNGQELIFGSLVRMSDAARNPQLVQDYPALSESLWRAASQQLRNMASLGGNLLQRTRCAYFRGGPTFPCNKRAPGSGCAALEGIDRGHALLGTSSACIASYPGDFAVALVAFDATIDIVGPRGPRKIAVEALHRLPDASPQLEHTLEPGELIARIRIPVSALGKGSVYHKIRDRESYAFALCSAATAVVVDDGRVSAVRIAVGGMASKPWRAREAERSLLGQRLGFESALATGRKVFEGARIGRHSAFRAELGARTVADALMTAAERAS